MAATIPTQTMWHGMVMGVGQADPVQGSGHETHPHLACVLAGWVVEQQRPKHAGPWRSIVNNVSRSSA